MMYKIAMKSARFNIPVLYYRLAHDICDLAKYLNERLKADHDYKVLYVSIVDDYNVYSDDDDSGLHVAFLPQEYNNQRFIETYEERLISAYEYQKMLALIV
jgi:hypothetical protein